MRKRSDQLKKQERYLSFLETIQTNLFNLFQEHPSLEELFDREFVSFKDFASLEYILELCFLDDFIFPDNEDFPLTSVVDGKFKEDYIGDYLDFFQKLRHLKKEKITKIFKKRLKRTLIKN